MAAPPCDEGFGGGLHAERATRRGQTPISGPPGQVELAGHVPECRSIREPIEKRARIGVQGHRLGGRRSHVALIRADPAKIGEEHGDVLLRHVQNDQQSRTPDSSQDGGRGRRPIGDSTVADHPGRLAGRQIEPGNELPGPPDADCFGRQAVGLVWSDHDARWRLPGVDQVTAPAARIAAA